jgi:non-lysosomal glucosylceramidase
MSAWATVLALTGFSYDGVTKEMAFAASDTSVTWFWSNGDAYGTLRQEPGANNARTVLLTVRGGTLPLSRFLLRGVGGASVNAPDGLAAGQSVRLIIAKQP